MRRYVRLAEAARDRPPGVERVATVGFFDGVHLGHARILADLRDWARAAGAKTAVVTFDRHPQAVLGGHPPVPVISLDHRLLLLERHGIDSTLVLRFDRELASWPPEAFIERVLYGALGAHRLLLGFDSAFGKGRKGNYDYLRERSGELGLEVRRSEAVYLDGERVSSTLVREALRRGDIARASALLGRPFSVLGRVVRGDGRGRELGFPTANLDLGEAAVLPRGVYFARVARLGRSLEGGAAVAPDAREALPAVMNVGRRPTVTGAAAREDEAFDPARDTVEVHILDFGGDLYGEYLEIFIETKHREERRFASIDELVREIRRDVAARRSYGT